MSTPGFNYEFNIDIPAANNNPSQDQPKMLNNNINLDSYVAEDHIPFGTVGSGLHQQVRMPAESTPTGYDGYGTTYCNSAESTSSTADETNLFYSPDSGGQRYQLTRTISSKKSLFGTNLSYGSPPAGFTQEGGWTFLAGGASDGAMLFQYGFYGKSIASGSSATIPFPVEFTNAPYCVQITPYKSGNTVEITIDVTSPPTTTGFTYNCSASNSSGFYWTAIGV